MPGLCGIFSREGSFSLGVERAFKTMVEGIHVKDDVFCDTFAESSIRLAKKTKGYVSREYIRAHGNRFVVAFDGYISNQEELREELGLAHGRLLPTSSLVARLHEKYQDSFVTKFNGVFLIVIFDRLLKRLLIIPDRMGYKKTYYHDDGKVLIFSNDYDGLVKSQQPPYRINRDSVWDIVNYNCVLGESSILEDFKIIPDGHYLVVSKNGLEKIRYWDFPSNVSLYKASEADLTAQTTGVIKAAVDRTIRTVKLNQNLRNIYVPLSGGLDSRLFAGLFSKKLENVEALNVGTRKWNETEISRAIADQLTIGWKLFDVLDFDFPGLEKEWELYSNGNTVMMNFTRFLPMFQYISSRRDPAVAVDGIGIDFLLQPAFLIYDVNVKEKDLLYRRLYSKFGFSSPDIIDLVFSKDSARKIKERAFSAIEEVLGGSQCSDSIDASRQFYFKTRSRKLIASGNAFWEAYSDFVYPGLDYKLFDHCVRIPLPYLKEGFLYRKCIVRLLPELHDITWAKTGKEITSEIGPKTKEARKFIKRVKSKLCVLSRGKVDLYTNKVSYERLYRKDEKFRRWVSSVLFNEEAKSRDLYDFRGIEELLNKVAQGHNLFRHIYTLMSLEKLFQKYA